MEPQHVLAGRYALISHLARGGMADVYVAEDRRLGRRVAVKVLHGQLARSDAFVERFRREAQAAAGLQHPNVVGIHDWGRDDDSGLYYMVMELVKGRNLRQVLKSEGTLLPQRVAEIASDVASALSAAHRAGVVHRDIKPANVLLTADGAVKVTDFGIARAWDDSEQLTRTGAVIGTATYFSPEQAQGLPADARSDIYSLGVVMYELLTGRPPFSGESPVAVAYQHVRETVPEPSTINPRIPPEIEDIVMQALAKDPAHRYQTADDMRDDLERYLAGIPPIATEETEATTRLGGAVAEGAGAGAAAGAAAGGMAGAAAGGAPTPTPPPRAPRPDYGAGSYAEPSRMSTSSWIIGIMAATALVGLALILLIRILSPSGDAAMVAIPDVRGATVEAATTVLEDLGLTVTPAEAPDAEIPAGLVAGTDPAAETEVESGSEVTLLVSTGPSSVAMPNLLDLTLDEARSILSSSGLVLGKIEFEVSAVVPADTVLSQDPLPGVVVEAGTVVDLVVSAGTDAIEMPDVVGKSQADALFQLSEAGFTSDQIVIDEQPSDEVLEGFVIATVPEAGNMVASTTTITVVVSSGSAPVEVPDVVGMDLDDAIDAIEALGLVAQQGDVIEVPFGDENDGKVISQDPSSGTELVPGDVVTVRVGASGEPVTVPNLIDVDDPLTFNEAKTMLEDLGLVVVQGPDVEVEYASPFDGHVAEQSPPPGTQVGEGAEVTISLGEAPEGIAVPDVVGLGYNAAQAEDRIVSDGLTYTYQASMDQTVPYGDSRDGKAAATNPTAGSVVAPNTEVKVGYYRAESGPRVPDLLGMTLTDAEDLLADLGFTNVTEDASCIPDDAGNDGLVAWQSVAPDTLVGANDPFSFRIGDLASLEACPAPPS
ncbi:MAG: Stk1 family PASTA domain-containing Ser/Thr kinase [Actinobacteria bacterium]|nr:Stk1 family PASTA domain-containing Ser/Thr kinase [Actinomycetota bacterium]